ncbi:MAG: hypothetical protein NXI19_09840 [Alphaproteobacteria bacterium]|nr:hypothetical protein [Alphaproteobacteria bacterium]
MMFCKRMTCALVGTGMLGLVAVTMPIQALAAEVSLRQSGSEQAIAQGAASSVSSNPTFRDVRSGSGTAFRLAQSTAPTTTPEQDHSAHRGDRQVPAGHAAEDTAMRNMYIAMGAMTGFMFAAMPVTTTAVSAAVGAGVATMWLYDVYMTPQSDM